MPDDGFLPEKPTTIPIWLLILLVILAIVAVVYSIRALMGA